VSGPVRFGEPSRFDAPAGSSDIARLMRTLLFCLVVLAGTVLYGAHLPDTEVSLQMQSTTGKKGEMFFAAPGEDYSPNRRVAFALVPDGQWHDYTVTLPADPIDRLRLDPGSTPGPVAVRVVEIRSGSRTDVFRPDRLLQAMGATHQVERRPMAGALQLLSTGDDPYFEIRLPHTIGIDLQSRVLRLLVIGASAFVLWWFLDALVSLLHRRWCLPERVTRALDALAASVSDDLLLRVDRRMLLVVAALALAATAYVGARLNQSAIGIWGTVYPTTSERTLGELGTPKRIRSDEWKVLTPWVFNQALRNFPLENPNVGGAGSPLLASVPIDGALGAPQLKFAGFHLFDLDRGLSWWWAYKSFGLLFSMFWLCLLLTRGNLAASVLGAAWIYASSFTQWWFSSDLPEILIAFALGTIGALYALFSTRRRLVVAGCVLVAYAAANLLQNLYPPFIVTLGYLAVAILAGQAMRDSALAHLRRGIAFRSVAIGLALVAIAAYAGLFATAAATSIDAMRHTVYPGQRIAQSGGVPTAKLLYGVFEGFRIGEHQFPLKVFSSNASEASAFVLLFPLVLLALPWNAWRRRDAALPLSLVAFSLLAMLWIGVHLPSLFERPLQALGWSLVTPKRAVLALGIGSILACIVAFAAAQDESDVPGYQRALRTFVVIGVAVGTVLFGLALRRADPTFFTGQVLILGIMACTLASAGIVFGRMPLLITGLALFALPTLSVNPLARGIAPLADKPILRAAERQGAGPADVWAVIGDNFLAQGLKAHGLAVFGGSAYLPDRNALRILDPNSRYADVWNRYATIRLKSAPGAALPVFHKTRGDQYAISLDICDGRLRLLGVNRVAYTVPTPAADLRCLEPLSAPSDSGVTLYRLK